MMIEKQKHKNHYGLRHFVGTETFVCLSIGGNPALHIPASAHKYEDINKHFWSLSSRISSLHLFFHPPSLPPFPPHFHIYPLGCLLLTSNIGEDVNSPLLPSSIC